MVDSTTAAPTGTPTEKMGIFHRWIGIYFFPTQVFQNLKIHPTWFVILILVGFALGLVQFSILSTETGMKVALEQAKDFTSLFGIDAPEEALKESIPRQRYLTPIGTVFGFLISCLFLSGFLYLVFNVFLGGEAKFKQVLAVSAHMSPILFLRGTLAFLLPYLKGSSGATTSLAAFLPFLDSDSLIYRIAYGLDFFRIWEVGVLSLGVSILYGFSGKKCASVLYGTFLGLVVVISLIIGLFA